MKNLGTLNKYFYIGTRYRIYGYREPGIISSILYIPMPQVYQTCTLGLMSLKMWTMLKEIRKI